MPEIKIIAVGKIKEKFMQSAIDEYAKRLSRFCKLNIAEIPDRPIPKNASPADEAEIIRREGEDILSKIGKNDFVVALCVEGSPLSSPALAAKISSAFNNFPCITFIIGGSLGLSDEVKRQSRLRLSMSEMTFPHNLARLMLFEQIYRAFKINNNETYHK